MCQIVKPCSSDKEKEWQKSTLNRVQIKSRCTDPSIQPMNCLIFFSNGHNRKRHDDCAPFTNILTEAANASLHQRNGQNVDEKYSDSVIIVSDRNVQLQLQDTKIAVGE